MYSIERFKRQLVNILKIYKTKKPYLGYACKCLFHTWSLFGGSALRLPWLLGWLYPVRPPARDAGEVLEPEIDQICFNTNSIF